MKALRQIFIVSTVGLLVFVGLSKIWTSFQPSSNLEFRDPIFAFLKVRYVALAAGAIELLLATALWRWRRSEVAFLLIALFSGILFTYRVGADWAGYTGSCACLGQPGKWILGGAQSVDRFTIGILAYWGIGVFVWLLARLYRLKRSNLHLWIISLLFLWSPENARADYISIKGSLEYSHAPSAPAQFEILLGDNIWSMKVQYGENWYSEIYGVGANIYDVHYDPKAHEDWPLPSTITPGNFPALHSPHVTVPWLAFCSADFFATSDWEDMPLPWLLARTQPEAHVCKANVEFLAGPRKTPKQIRFITSATRLTKAHEVPTLRAAIATDRERRSRVLSLKTRFAPNQLLGMFSVTQSTNLNGIAIPLAFELETFAIKSEKSRRTANMAGFYRGQVSYAAVRSGNVTLPTFTKAVTVADYRLSERRFGISYVVYNIRNQAWKTKVDSELQNLLRQKRHDAILAKLQQLGKQSLIISVMLLLAAVPAFILFHHRLKHSGKLKTRMKGDR